MTIHCDCSSPDGGHHQPEEGEGREEKGAKLVSLEEAGVAVRSNEAAQWSSAVNGDTVPALSCRSMQKD